MKLSADADPAPQSTSTLNDEVAKQCDTDTVSTGAIGKQLRNLPAGLGPAETGELLINWCREGISYSNSRKQRFKGSASIVWLLSLCLSAASAIILGIQDLNFWSSIGFVLVSVSTLVRGFEPFFNWRSRWILAEEAQYKFYALERDIKYHLATTVPADLTISDLKPFYERYGAIWQNFSERWLESRRQGSFGN
jgi:hypothetical protein